MKINPSIFKAYDIRGKYPNEVNEEAATRIGNATVVYLSKLLKKKRLKIIVCRDVRLSSSSLKNALLEGITSAGGEVLDAGIGTTPYFYFLLQRLKPDGGIMVTASHNPAEYNGFKIRGRGGKEISIGSGLEKIKEIALRGKIVRTASPEVITFQNYVDEYIEFLRRGTRIGSLDAVIDAAGGSTAFFLPKLLTLFDKFIYLPLFFEPDGSFEKHPPNPLLPEAQRFVKNELSKGKFHFGAVFDGDGDRVLFFDEKGNAIRSEYIVALLAANVLKNYPGSAFVFPVNASKNAREYIAELGGKIKISRVGQTFMSEAMKKWRASMGCELSGHFYFRDFFYKDSALMTWLRLAEFLSQTHRPLSQLVKPLEERYISSGEINFQVQNRKAALKRIKYFYRGAKISFLDGITVEYPEWWCNVRPSNTEPLVRLVMEAKTRDIFDAKKKELETIIGNS
jgi:phosphomannomutase